MTQPLEDYFKSFLALKRSRRLKASVQAVYMAILGEFYLHDFPERISLSTRTLMELSGLKSEATAHEAKNILKNHRLIDFYSAKSGTTYFLPDISQNARTNTANAVFGKKNEHQGLVSCALNNAHADALARDLFSNTNHSQEIDRYEDTKIQTNIYLSISSEEEEKKDTDTDTGTDKDKDKGAGVRQTRSGESAGLKSAQNEESVQEFWEREAGYKLFGVFAQELEALDMEYGRQNIREALKTAKRWNKNKQRLPFNYFKVVLDDVAIWDEETTRGGERRGEDKQRTERAEKPKRGKYPWE